MDDQELQELILRYYASDGEDGKRAGDELTERVYRRLWTYLRWLSGSQEVADDLAQEPFLRLAGTKTTGKGRYQPLPLPRHQTLAVAPDLGLIGVVGVVPGI